MSTLVHVGCGTLLGSKQVLSFDSQPRGLDVYEHRNGRYTKKPIGTTPFFYKTPRKLKKRFAYRDASGRRVTEFDNYCGGRWLEAVLPDTLIGISNPILGGSFLLVDLLTENIFECEPFYHFADPLAKPTAEVCRRFGIVPPKSQDLALSNAIVKAWKEQAREHVNECDRFVYSEKLRDEFLFLGIDHQSRFRLKDQPQNQILQLAESMRLSHMLVLKHKGASTTGEYDIETRVFDLHLKKRVKSNFPKISVTVPQTWSKSRIPFLVRNIHIIPNSVTLGYPVNSLGLDAGKSNVRYEVENHEKRPLPSLLSGWGVDAVEHPNGFYTWDFAFRMYPSVRGLYSERHIKYRGLLTDVPSAELKYRAMMVMPQFIAAIKGFSPIGILTLSVGGGLALYDYSDNLNHSFDRATTLLSFNFKYEFFITKRLYFFSEVNSYSLGENIPVKVEPKGNVFEGSITAGSSGLGYFFPETRRLARRLL